MTYGGHSEESQGRVIYPAHKHSKSCSRIQAGPCLSAVFSSRTVEHGTEIKDTGGDTMVKAFFFLIKILILVKVLGSVPSTLTVNREDPHRA